MSSDNQYTALGPAAIGFQTNSNSITTGASIAGTQGGAVLIGQTTLNTAPSFGALVTALFPDVAINNIPQYTGVAAFGEPWAVVGMSGAEIRAIGGSVTGAKIPFTVDYGVVGAALQGPGVFGVGDEGGQAPPNLQVSSTGVMGVSQSGPGVTGVSLFEAGVLGSSDDVGVVGISPNGTGAENLVGNIHNAGVLGGGSGSVVGVMGVSDDDRGGVFQSINSAQLRLIPSSVPLENNPALMQNGKVGDLYFFSVAQEVGTSGTFDYTSILWLCIAPASPPAQAVWAQIQLGDTIGG